MKTIITGFFALMFSATSFAVSNTKIAEGGKNKLSREEGAKGVFNVKKLHYLEGSRGLYNSEGDKGKFSEGVRG